MTLPLSCTELFGIIVVIVILPILLAKIQPERSALNEKGNAIVCKGDKWEVQGRRCIAGVNPIGLNANSVSKGIWLVGSTAECRGRHDECAQLSSPSSLPLSLSVGDRRLERIENEEVQMRVNEMEAVE
jgi:hypothetical protein